MIVFIQHQRLAMVAAACISTACANRAGQEVSSPALLRDGHREESPFEGRVLARCALGKKWLGSAFLHTSKTPFSVLVGKRNQWFWVGKSSQMPGTNAEQLEVPLEYLAADQRLDGNDRDLQMFVVSGDATVDDVVVADDGLLNYWIYQHQHPSGASADQVRLVHDKLSQEKPEIIAATQCIAPPSRPHLNDSCTTPQCPL